MKTNWQTKKLDEVCYFLNGLWKGKQPPYRNVGVIRNTNFTREGSLDDTNISFIDVEESKFKKRKLIHGDVILEKSGGGPKQPVGRVIIFDKKEGDYSFSNFTSAIRVKNNKELDSRFLHKYLYYSYIIGVTAKMQSHSTGIRNLNLGEYKDIQMPIPPIEEQLRIVIILDKAFAEISKARENVEKNLHNVQDLFESYLENYLTNSTRPWEVVLLGDICKITDGTHYSPKNTSVGKYMYVTAKNIKPNFIDLTKITYISEKDHKEIYKRCPVKKGDILYIKDGATTGIATLNTIEEEFSLLSSVALLKPSHKVLNQYLVYYMNSTIGRKNFLGKIDGTAITRLTLVKLKNVQIPLLSIDKQEEIVAILETLSIETKKLEEIYKKKIVLLDELKKSLLHQAFTCKL